MNRRLLLLAAFLGLTSCAPAAKPVTSDAAKPSATKSGDPLDQEVPLDKRVTKGTLANGLTYYILPHQKPEKRAQFWLAVNAGSLQEDDDQQGLAHFLEHMGFNGTKRFPKQDLVKFLESIGVKFGPDLNAYTSWDQTVYMLQVPTDKPELVEKSFAVLRDWASDISLDEEEVKKERGVVLEEWRLGRGAWRRIFDKQAPVIFKGSKYAERITIGKPEIISGATRETLLRYYKDWYRPDMMAVIAVGDFDGAAIRAQIEKEFGDLKNPAKPRPRPVEPVPPHAETLVSIETDPEMTRTGVSVMTKFPHRPEKTARDQRRMLVEGLHRTMFNSRLDEIRRRPSAPFIAASAGTSEYVRPIDVFSYGATVKDDGVEAGLAAILEEMARVEKHGFLQSELDRAKKDILRSYRRAVQERDKQEGRQFAEEITRNFFEGEMMGGSEAELALAEAQLPTVTLEELNALGKQFGANAGSRVILVSGPDKMKKPAKEALLAIVDQVAAKKDLAPWDDGASSAPLIAKMPVPGKVTKTEMVPEIGVTVWTLSNGVRVVHKETDFKNDEVLLAGFSPGGTSLVKDAEWDTARYADSMTGEGGLGTFDATQLRKALSGKVAYAGAGLGELEEWVNGSASPEDLETMLQLLHLRITAPREDSAAVTSWKERMTEIVKNRRLDPESVFNEDYYSFLASNHLRRQPMTPESIAAAKPARGIEIYKERFGDAGDFTFIFVGNVPAKTLQGLAEIYLGSLPSKGRKETWKDVDIVRPKGTPTKRVEQGSEPKARVTLTFHGVEKWSKDAQNDMQMLGEVLRFRLREILREDLGGVYGVSAGGAIARRPKDDYSFTVSFGCAPENVEKLKGAVLSEIQAIQKQGIGEEYLQKLKEARIRGHEVNLKSNGWWLAELRRAYTYGDDPKEIPDIAPELAQVSSDRVRNAAKKYLRIDQYSTGILLPAKK